MNFKADKFNESDNNYYYEYDYSEETTDFKEEYDDDVQVKKPRRLLRFIIRFVCFCFFVIAVNIGVLLFSGKLWFNQPDKKDYPIRGAFVNTNMGAINWNTFANQNLSIAYIKATEGIAFKDESFEKYWLDSKECSLTTGAYHVFSPTKNGIKQAEHFCDIVGKSIKGRLISAVDFSLTGIYALFPPDVVEARNNLTDFCNYIKQQYGVAPIIITDKRCYEKYLKNFENKFIIKHYFSDIDQELPSDFWCYNPRVRVKGYENSKEYFSMFVYCKNVNIDDFLKEFVC